jgi:hypothetical protein
MDGPLINILVRTTKGRDTEFRKCVKSVCDQTYKNKHLIIITDDKDRMPMYPPLTATGVTCQLLYVAPTGVPFHWNFYCNNLKERVTDGWFFYCDDDDFLYSPTVLEDIAPHLTNPSDAVICQFNRGVHAKPVYDYCELFSRSNGSNYIKPSAIVRGKIGGSCIFLHHSQKDIAHWDGQRAADYRFIKAVSEQIPLKFVPKVVVQAGNKGRRGK